MRTNAYPAMEDALAFSSKTQHRSREPDSCGAASETGAVQRGRLMVGGWAPLESDVMQRLQNQSPVEREVQGNVGLGHLFRNCWEGQKGNRITGSPRSDRESCFLPQSSRGRAERSSSKETPIAVAATIQVGDESCWHTLSVRLETEWGGKPSVARANLEIT